MTCDDAQVGFEIEKSKCKVSTPANLTQKQQIVKCYFNCNNVLLVLIGTTLASFTFFVFFTTFLFFFQLNHGKWQQHIEFLNRLYRTDWL
jgi:hypothetical protein